MADTVYNSTGGVNATTPTDPTKKKNLNLPYMQTGQNQVMPLASTAVNAGANAQGQPTGQLAPVQPMQVQPLSPIQYFTDQQKAENEKKTENGQEARVNNTYQQATQQKQDPLQSLIGNTYAQQIQNYSQNAQQNVQNTLENYDVQRAKAFEAARQAGAGAADSGIFQNDLLQTQLQNLRDRGNLEQQTKTANLENLNKVLSGAQTSATQQQTANDQFMKNLIAATQAGEGEANRQQAANEASLGRAQELLVQANDIQGNKDIETLKGKIAAGQATTDYERQAAENALDRALEVALQKGDQQAAKELEALKGQIQSGLQKEQFAQQTKENALDRTNALLLSNNEIEGNKALTTLKAKLDADQATTNYERQQAMDALSRAHDIAMQNGDIAGKMAIEKLQGEITSQINRETQAWQTGERVASQIFSTSERLSTQDYDAGQKYLDRENQKSMQMQDYYNNLNLQQGQFDQEKTMAKITADLDEAKAANDYQRTYALTRLKESIDLGLQTAGFAQEEKMAYINGQIADAKANNDYSRAKGLERLKGSIEAGLQDDAQQAASDLAYMEQSNQRYLADQNAMLQMKMQMQGFTNDQQLKYIDAAIAESKANGDAERSRQLMGYQTQLNLQELGAKAGYDEKKAYLDNELAKALQDNDAEHAEVLQKARLDQEAQQFSEEMIIKRAAQALEEKKVDIAQVENDYNKVVEMFGEDSEAAHEFLINTLNANGIDTSGNEYAFVDATEQAKKALQAEYDLQKDQFMQSHPEYYQKVWMDANGKEYSLATLQSMDPANTEQWANQNMNGSKQTITPEGNVALNEYINSAIYGEETAAEKEARENAGYLNASDIPMAEAGQKFNITTPSSIKTADGSTMTLPAGKYYTDSKTNTHGNSFAGKTSVTHLYLYNESGERVAELKQNTVKGAAGWKTMADPVLGIFEGV